MVATANKIASLNACRDMWWLLYTGAFKCPQRKKLLDDKSGNPGDQVMMSPCKERKCPGNNPLKIASERCKL